MNHGGFGWMVRVIVIQFSSLTSLDANRKSKLWSVGSSKIDLIFQNPQSMNFSSSIGLMSSSDLLIWRNFEFLSFNICLLSVEKDGVWLVKVFCWTVCFDFSLFIQFLWMKILKFMGTTFYDCLFWFLISMWCLRLKIF